MVKKILFICKYNRFRSRIAEAYLKKINKNVLVDSAGVIQGNRIDEPAIKAGRKFGMNIGGKPKGLSSKLLESQDLVVIVASNVPKSLIKDKEYNRGKIVMWKIVDARNSSEKERVRIIEQIIRKVDKLNKGLNKK